MRQNLRHTDRGWGHDKTWCSQKSGSAQPGHHYFTVLAMIGAQKDELNRYPNSVSPFIGAYNLPSLHRARTRDSRWWAFSGDDHAQDFVMGHFTGFNGTNHATVFHHGHAISKIEDVMQIMAD